MSKLSTEQQLKQLEHVCDAIDNPENIEHHAALEKLKKLIKELVPQDAIRTHFSLADVLRASNKKHSAKGHGEILEITDYGMFCGELYNWEEEPVMWNLEKDLDGQDEATILFLIELLE